MRIKLKDKLKLRHEQLRNRLVFFWFPWYYKKSDGTNRFFIWLESEMIEEIYSGYHEAWSVNRIGENLLYNCREIRRLLSLLLW